MLASPHAVMSTSDSSQSPDRRAVHRPWIRRLLLNLVMSTVMIALASAWVPAVADADGDPASDVLVSQSVFVPADAGVSVAQQLELDNILGAADRAGLQIRVALIASPSDLGSITALWGQPENYAHFLGEELSLLYHGRVLVVMPAGFGLYQTGASTGAEVSALEGIKAPSPRGLVDAGVAAVERLAADSGHPLSAPGKPTSTGRSPVSGSSATISWVVFAIGGALIAMAWIASLRARPLRAGGGTTTA